MCNRDFKFMVPNEVHQRLAATFSRMQKERGHKSVGETAASLIVSQLKNGDIPASASQAVESDQGGYKEVRLRKSENKKFLARMDAVSPSGNRQALAQSLLVRALGK